MSRHGGGILNSKLSVSCSTLSQNVIHASLFTETSKDFVRTSHILILFTNHQDFTILGHHLRITLLTMRILILKATKFYRMPNISAVTFHDVLFSLHHLFLLIPNGLLHYIMLSSGFLSWQGFSFVHLASSRTQCLVTEALVAHHTAGCGPVHTLLLSFSMAEDVVHGWEGRLATMTVSACREWDSRGATEGQTTLS